MTTLAEKRKDAIKVHVNRMEGELNNLSEMSEAMRKVGLVAGADELQTIGGSIKFELMKLKTAASVN